MKPVLRLDVPLRQGDVAPRHLQAGVPEELLEGKQVAAAAEERHGERVPERVRGASGVLDLGGLAQPLDDLAHAPARQGLASARPAVREKDRRGRLPCVLPQVVPQRLGGGLTEVQRPPLASLSHDLAALRGHVEVADAQRAELRGAHARVEQEEEDGVVAQGVPRPAGGREQQRDLALRERLDLVRPDRGRRDRLHRGGRDHLLGHEPAEEGPQAAVVGVDGGGADGARQRRVAPAPALGLVAVRDVGEELPQLLLAAGGVSLLAKEPQELVADEAAVAKSREGVLADVAVEEPARELVFEFGRGDTHRECGGGRGGIRQRGGIR